jgi:hypothetical protein
MSRLPSVLVLLLVVGLSGGQAAGGQLRLGENLSEEEFASLADALGDAIAFPLLSIAAPLGALGFEAVASAGGPMASSSAGWWRNGVEGSPTLGVMPGRRLVVRKGLPARMGVGFQAGQVLDQSFWGVEGRWTLLEGGILVPSVTVRGSHSRLVSSPVGVEVSEIGLSVSKGLVLVTPYAGVSYRWTRAEGAWGTESLLLAHHRSERVVVNVGARVALGPAFVVAEGFQGSRRGILVGIGVRL